jgi:hypothetical protein
VFVALPDDLAWRVRATLGAADWQLAVAEVVTAYSIGISR